MGVRKGKSLCFSFLNTKLLLFQKCDLYHWIDILDIFDSILEQSCKKENENQWSLPVDQPENEKVCEFYQLQFCFISTFYFLEEGAATGSYLVHINTD